MAFEIDFLESYDRDSIVEELRRIAKLLGKGSVSRRDIDQYGRLNSRTVMHKFGTMRKAHEAAGLVPSRFTKTTDDELLQIVANLWSITLERYGRSPRRVELEKFGFHIAPTTIVERFGSWRKALVAASTWTPGPKTVAANEVTPRRPAISVRKRYLVFRRDRFTCRMCKRAGGVLEVDHVVPKYHGGSDLLHNLQTLCADCNRGKGKSLE